MQNPPSLIVEDNLGGDVFRLDLAVEGAVDGVDLLLDGRAELEEVVGDGLAGGLEDVDEPVRIVLVRVEV